MKLELILFPAILWAFTAAMVPRERRGADEYGDKTICLPSTPCAWTPYNKVTRKPDLTILNNYCTCPSVGDSKCTIDTDDKQMASYVHHCRSPDFQFEEP